MQSNLYVIKDSVSGNTCPVFQQLSDPAAIRHFNGYLRAMPIHMREDFSLHCVGSIDDLKITIEERQVMQGACVAFPGEEVKHG